MLLFMFRELFDGAKIRINLHIPLFFLRFFVRIVIFIFFLICVKMMPHPLC